MKTEIAIYVGNPSLSEAIQTMAFNNGFEWHGGSKEVSELDKKILYLHKSDKDIVFAYSDDDPIDYDASTEFGKIVEWFCEADKDTEIERLKREITQLRDELDTKSTESFPEGYDWHNPRNLTPEQVEVKDGWRLLLKEEVQNTGGREPTHDIQSWSKKHSSWCGSETFYGASWDQTYRTKWPLPSLKNTPTRHPDTKTVSESTDDDFPTPERQEKEAGLKWFLEYLKRCKEVKGWVAGKVREVEVNYGKCGGGAELISHDGDVFLRDNYGDIHRIAITQINP